MLETISNPDETTLLGYFETIKCVFFTKLLLISASADHDMNLILPFNPSEILQQLRINFNDEISFKAIEQGNQEIILNLMDDLVSSSLIGAWSIFELTIKSLQHGNYANQSTTVSFNYNHRVFQFTAREKKDIGLFYYIRNAIVHYNGAYSSYKEIDRQYKGATFKSAENEGNKIVITPRVAFDIVSDLEMFSIKAWTNGNKDI